MPDLATQLLAIDERIKDLDQRVTTTFRSHPQAAIIESLPGLGPILGAELIAAAGDLNGYANADRPASAAGLVPVPKDSGRRTGNLHRPMGYSRKLRRVLYLSARASMMREGPNRDQYLKKRSEGDKHVQALICLARLRVDVWWARGYVTTGPSNSPRQPGNTGPERLSHEQLAGGTCRLTDHDSSSETVLSSLRPFVSDLSSQRPAAAPGELRELVGPEEEHDHCEDDE